MRAAEGIEANRPSKEVVVGELTSALLHTLCARKPRVWPRHRWTGFREALGDLCLLEAIHGLLSPAYQRFLNLLRAGGAPPEAAAGASVNPGAADAAGAAVQQGQGGEELGEEGLGAEGSDRGDQHLADANAKDRRLARSWLLGDPFGNLLLISVALDPLDRLLHEHFKFGSKQWEAEQRAGLAETQLSGQQGHRVYRAQIAADLTLETRFHAALSQRFFSENP